MRNLIIIGIFGLTIFSCKTIKLESGKDKSYIYKELIKEFEESSTFKKLDDSIKAIEIFEAIDTINKTKRIEFLKWQDPMVVLPSDDFHKNFIVNDKRIYYWNDPNNTNKAFEFYNLLNDFGVRLDSCARYSHLTSLNCESYLIEVNAPTKLYEFKIFKKKENLIYKRK